jgi:hypothetical protein
MDELIITITEDNVVYLEMWDEDSDLTATARFEPTILTVQDYRSVKPKRKRWWNL